MPRNNEMTKIIAKHVCGRRTTHNGDGSYTLVWRLWSDGRVERTSSKSRYQPYFADEQIPAEITAAAQSAGVEIQQGRTRTRDARGARVTKITALRLPPASREQLLALATKLGMNMTQVAMIAIDRMFHAEVKK